MFSFQRFVVACFLGMEHVRPGRLLEVVRGRLDRELRGEVPDEILQHFPVAIELETRSRWTLVWRDPYFIISVFFYFSLGQIYI